MKNIFYILKRDTKRILTNWVALLIVIGVCILPSFYAWFNIGANYDPYHNTSGIQIAVANEDAGTTFESNKLNAGSEIEKALKKNKKIGWVFVSSDKAKSGVRSGEYYAALIIPENFSSNLISFIDGKTENPIVKYYVNEKKNAVAPKITDTGASTVQQTVDTIFKGAVIGVVTEVITNAAGSIKAGVDGGSSDLIGTIDETRNTIGKYRKSISQFHDSYGTLNSALNNAKGLADSLDSNMTALQKSVQAGDRIVSAAEADTAYLNAEVKKFKEEHPEILPVLTEDLITRLTEMDIKLTAADKTLNTASGLITTVKPAAAITEDMLDNLKTGVKHTDSALTSMSGALESTDSLLSDARAALKSLQSSDLLVTLSQTADINVEEAAEFMAAPVKLKQVKLYPVETYGSGMTPFYTMLAIWVSGFILIAIFKLEVDTAEEKKRRITMHQSYLGRGLLFTILGIIQSVIICIGDMYILKIQCLHPLMFILAGIITSIVFVNLIYALASAFRHVGKALAVILVILQIPGSSGTYPIELTSEFFQKINPFLPFTYGISAMRETIGGLYGNTYWQSISMLLLFLVVALFIGLVLRPLLMNFNHTFDTRLEDTGLFESDFGLETVKVESIRRLVRILSGDNESREYMGDKIEKFEKYYEKILNTGIILALIPPVVLLLLLFILPAKITLLCLWVISIILLCAFLFIIEHTHQTISQDRYAGDVLPEKEVSEDE